MWFEETSFELSFSGKGKVLKEWVTSSSALNNNHLFTYLLCATAKENLSLVTSEKKSQTFSFHLLSQKAKLSQIKTDFFHCWKQSFQTVFPIYMWKVIFSSLKFSFDAFSSRVFACIVWSWSLPVSFCFNKLTQRIKKQEKSWSWKKLLTCW